MKKKTYRVTIIDWNKPKNKIISERFICGLADVKEAFPNTHFHFSRNCRVWVAYNNNYEYIAVEC